MLFDDRTYSVLLVSSSPKFNDSVSPLLPRSQFFPVAYASSASGAKRELSEKEYDIIIVNSPLKDEFGTRFSSIASDKGSVVLLLVKSDEAGEVRSRVTSQGVFTLEKPVSASSFERAVLWLTAARERLRKAQEVTLSVEEKMAEIRLVNRAKWALIENEGMTENEAHRYIEKQAMDRCVSKAAVAGEIISRYN